MIKLEDIQRNAPLEGVEPGQVVRVVATEPAGADGITLVYRTAEGKIQERMLFRADEPNLSIATVNRPWSFEASGEELKLGIEAYRIRFRSDDGGAYVGRYAASAPDYRRVRVHASPATSALCAG